MLYFFQKRRMISLENQSRFSRLEGWRTSMATKKAAPKQAPAKKAPAKAAAPAKKAKKK
jgi:hypothetical protein